MDLHGWQVEPEKKEMMVLLGQDITLVCDDLTSRQKRLQQCPAGWNVASRLRQTRNRMYLY